ncbi:hypothetical protein ACWDA7_47945 [Streptomyces sp. NPDC001156]
MDSAPVGIAALLSLKGRVDLLPEGLLHQPLVDGETALSVVDLLEPV